MWDRQKAIDTLVNDDINTFTSNRDMEWIMAEILEGGFKGYANYTDEQLMQELMERDIPSEVYHTIED